MDENNKHPEAQEVKTPDFQGEEMKMPESSGGGPIKTEESKVINGTLLAVLALLLIIILGGMYYWFTTINTAVPTPTEPPTIDRPTDEENDEPESTTAEGQTDMLDTVSTSDEISAIEADIEATDLSSLDAELDAIDAEIEAAMEEE